MGSYYSIPDPLIEISKLDKTFPINFVINSIEIIKKNQKILDVNNVSYKNGIRSLNIKFENLNYNIQFYSNIMCKIMINDEVIFDRNTTVTYNEIRTILKI